jgi:hypothetical protein
MGRGIRPVQPLAPYIPMQRYGERLSTAALPESPELRWCQIAHGATCAPGCGETRMSQLGFRYRPNELLCLEASAIAAYWPNSAALVGHQATPDNVAPQD